MNKKLKVCVAGASGFVGQELIKLLVKHPHVEIMHLFVNNLEMCLLELAVSTSSKACTLLSLAFA